ncbi:MAG: glycoside hydrolase family 32 protein [Terracidiphilus sp.]|jgi:sucrose-6-phosphate hydrolase SacC (GH32 family)
MTSERLGHRLAKLTARLLLVPAIIAAPQLFAQLPAGSQDAAVPAAAWQPRIHFYAPPNWINDPNGPILLNGQYHLFFQLDRYGDQGGKKSWGHAVSTDLAHWEQLPLALADENGVSIFSGSTVEDADNTSGLCGEPASKTPGCLVAIYTGATFGGTSADGKNLNQQNQNLAVSRDGGMTWTKYSGNPVLDLGLPDFRDPKVFWHEPSQSWVMVVALPDKHKVRIYRSKNLKQWELASEFGPAGAVGGVWECPDLMELPVRDGKGNRISSRWVLNVNLNPGGFAGGSGDQYFVGQFDGFRFVEDHPGSGPHWADWGKDFYASTSFANVPADQDRIWIAWMSNWQYASKLPSLPGRGEMTVPRRLYLRQPPPHPAPTPSQEPLLLVQQPILPVAAHKQYEAMFGAPQFETIPETNAHLANHQPAGSAYLLRLTLEPGDASEVGIRLRRSASNPNDPAAEETLVGIEIDKGRIFVDRTRSGRTDWSANFPARVSAPLKHSQAVIIPLEIVVDSNSIEVFAEDGETVLTDLIYPAATSLGLAFYATPTPPGSAPARVRDVELISLEQPGK